MITTTSNYDTENAKANKWPIWTVEFSGVTTKLASGTYGDITANHKQYISDMNINRRVSHFLDARSGNSYAEFTVIDKDAEITAMIAADNLFGIQATIKQGFVGLDDADFITSFIGRVEEIKLNGGSYTFIVEDYFPKNQDYLFRKLLSGTNGYMNISRDV